MWTAFRPSVTLREKRLQAKPNFMKHLTQSNYKSDKLYPSVVRAVTAILERSSFVAPVDVLMETQRLDKKLYDDWRFGRVPYLERITNSGLSNLNRILRIIALHCQAIGLRPSQTVYNRFGKGPKTRLQFSKSGESNLETAYSTHWVQKQSREPAANTDLPKSVGALKVVVDPPTE